MTFKQSWEKASFQHHLPLITIEGMVRAAYSTKKLATYKVLGGGCANINVIITMQGETAPQVLRVYLRDQEAANREKALAFLLTDSVPVPMTYYVGDYASYRFALIEYMPGMTLRELLLSQIPHDIYGLMHQVGHILAKIAGHSYPAKPVMHVSYVEYARGCLDNKMVATQLGQSKVALLDACLRQYAHLFPSAQKRQLVHGDFDPANILVEERQGIWQITAVLDWEFAFSGSVLCDIANMLRYAHHMPSIFEEAFLQGLREAGIVLPTHWRMTMHMLNLLSLLDCLCHADPINRPNQILDIGCLIDYHLNKMPL